MTIDVSKHNMPKPNLKSGHLRIENITFGVTKAVREFPIPAIAIFLLVISGGLWLARRGDLAQWPLLIIIIIGGAPLVWSSLKSMYKREFGVDFIALMAIAGSLLLQEYLAGAFVVLMMSGGSAIETFALQRARSSLTALAERAPRTAHMMKNDTLVDVPADYVEVGMIVVLKPGEAAPVDGEIIDGSCNISEADITGEAVPVKKTVGDQILSGSVLLDTVISVKALKRSSESKYAQIVKLVAEAEKQRAPIHRLADRYSVWFTLFTVIAAALAWGIFRDGTYALAVLVVATPCPLILATPIAIMAGVDAAARKNIIVKSGAAIEGLGEVSVAIFDKTGTLTEGKPQVTGILSLDNKNRLVAADQKDLQYIASVEQFSAHILARAITGKAKETQLSLYSAENFYEDFGKGASADITTPDGTITVAVGSKTYMANRAVSLPDALMLQREKFTEDGAIASFYALNGRAAGLLILSDVIRPQAAQLIQRLKALGIQETVLLTGDGETAANKIGGLAGLDRIAAKCLPEDKVRIVGEIERSGKHALMVGDGVNDAPALASATVGMAIGAEGLTAASSAADAVLLSSDITHIAFAVRQGKWSLHIAKQGIFVGMGLSAVAMLFAAFGFIAPPVGAILQECIDVLVILNALRARNIPEQFIH